MDYTQPSSGLTIASGTTRECITVATTEDDILEDNESFSLSLSTSDPNVTVTTDTATVNITEDADSVTVGFTATSYTIEEGMSMMSACVSVEGGELERDITVTVSSMDDSAIGKPTVVYMPLIPRFHTGFYAGGGALFGDSKRVGIHKSCASHALLGGSLGFSIAALRGFGS